jgi:hypothetical protein
MCECAINAELDLNLFCGPIYGLISLLTPTSYTMYYLKLHRDYKKSKILKLQP